MGYFLKINAVLGVEATVIRQGKEIKGTQRLPSTDKAVSICTWLDGLRVTFTSTPNPTPPPPKPPTSNKCSARLQNRRSTRKHRLHLYLLTKNAWKPTFKTECWASGFQSGTEEARSCRSVLKASTSMNRLKKIDRLSQVCQSEVTGQTATRRDQQGKTVHHQSPGRKPTPTDLWGASDQVGKTKLLNWQTVGGLAWTSGRDSKGTQSLGGPIRLCILPLQGRPDPPSEYQRKIPSSSWQGQEPFWNKTEHCALDQVWPPRNCLTRD